MNVAALIQLLELHERDKRVTVLDGQGFAHNIQNLTEEVSEEHGRRFVCIHTEFQRTKDFT